MQYCFIKAGSSLVIKAEQRSNISRAQNYHSKMTWIYCSISWGLSWKSSWISNYERKRMDRSELLKTTVSNSKFSQNLKPVLYSETVAFIIPLHCAGLAWQRADSRSVLWHSHGRILCSPLRPHRQHFLSVTNTESSQRAAGLVRGEWQFLSENLYINQHFHARISQVMGSM